MDFKGAALKSRPLSSGVRAANGSSCGALMGALLFRRRQALQRTIQTRVLDPLAAGMLAGTIHEDSTVTVDIEKDAIVFRTEGGK